MYHLPIDQLEKSLEYKNSETISIEFDSFTVEAASYNNPTTKEITIHMLEQNILE